MSPTGLPPCDGRVSAIIVVASSAKLSIQFTKLSFPGTVSVCLSLMFQDLAIF